MKKRRENIALTIASINCEIEALEELLSITSSIRMQAIIEEKIYALEKEKYLYRTLMNL